MTDVVDIGPADLSQDYLAATNDFMTTAKFGNVVMTQMRLDLPVSAGLAYEIETYQDQLKGYAATFFKDVSGKFIHQVSLGLNFVALWKAQAEIDVPLLRQAGTNSKARDSSVHVYSELSEQAGRINQFAADLNGTLSVYNGKLGPLNGDLQKAIGQAITELGKAAEQATAEIDALNKTIAQNIDDIVAGANEAGSAVSELLIGVLTTIADAKPDKKSDEGEGKNSGEGGGGSTPSTDFAVTSIKAGTEGVEKTAQARADLKANNEKLADAYQKLAQANALTAVGKVVAVQAAQFTDAMATLEKGGEALASGWGRSPITGSGSGRSLAFQQFADQIAALTDNADAERLAKQVEFTSNDWKLLGDRLQSLKSALVAED